MKECHIEISDRVTPEITSCIAEGLERFNDTQIVYGARLPMAVVVKDPASGDVLGGITGRSSLGLLFLDLFYLPEALRGTGLGSELLRRFEQEGRRRGCLSAVLYTISFQAPEFYQRHGWQRMGEVPCLPPGTSRIFMSKTL
ncbi:GNAT family N-acetyltransferase [Serratia marcescens]|uniref:GNAT family N-acetyltransferase n=1 Tax=Serratia marcescens TaxID=615 RepID=UPI002FD97445